MKQIVSPMKHKIIGICKFIDARSTPLLKSDHSVFIPDEVFLNHPDALSDTTNAIIIEENRKAAK